MLTREQYFPGHSPEEQVALFIRRHWMAFLPWMLIPPILLAVSSGLALYLWLQAALSPDIRTVIVIGLAVLYLAVLFLLLRGWMSYYLDVTIVTERRLVDIEQDGIFIRRISEQSLLRVQDVSARQYGFFQTYLNYGNLYIETAGEQPNFELHNIPRPNDVAKTILNLHDRLVGVGGHDVELAVAEGSLGPVTKEFSQTVDRPRHPLEELRPYFPEPSELAHRHQEKNHPIPTNKTVHSQEGDLEEGKTIEIDRLRS